MPGAGQAVGKRGVPSSGLVKAPAALQPLSTSRLKDFFYRSSNLQYFKRLIQIPQLPEVSVPGTAEPRGPVLEAGRRAGFEKCVFPLQNPPNFLRASALSEHVSPVVVIPAEASSPDSEPVLEKDDLMGMDASQQVRTS